MGFAEQSPTGQFKRSLVANVVNVSLSTITGIFIPRALGAAQYGYWQVLVLYLTYIQYFHCGWIDGMYLRLSPDADRNVIHTQFVLSVGFDLLISLLFCLVGWWGYRGSWRLVLVLVGCECLLWLPRVFLQYVLQGTDRVQVYARDYILERTLVAGGQLVVLACGCTSFLPIALCDLGGKLVTLVHVLVCCRDVVGARWLGLRSGLVEAGKDFRCGFKVTVATVSGMLMIGIIQFTIAASWPIDTFGLVSFALVSLSCTVQFLNQVSVVLLPLLRKSPEDRYGSILEAGGFWVLDTVATLFVLYFVLEKIMLWLLPAYGLSIRYLSCLVPAVFLEGRTTPLLNTLLKARRKETSLLVINLGMMAVSAITTFVTVVVCHDLLAVILSIVLLLALRMVCAEIVVQRDLGVRDFLGPGLSLGMAAVAFFAYVVVDGWKGWGCYLAVFLCYRLVFSRRIAEAKRLLQSDKAPR